MGALMETERRVLLTGATGFVGRALVRRLVTSGYHCIVLTRSPETALKTLPAGVTAYRYDEPWPAAPAVINLAGESILGRWTARKRRRVLESRTKTTEQLVTWISTASPRPVTFLSMSAVGIYGDRPGERLTEESAPDGMQKFRAGVTLAWEAAAQQATESGVRVVLLRLGNVLHPAGGYLGALLRIYRFLPVVAPAPPDTMLSWISRRDATRLILFALEQDEIQGPLNLTSPHPTTHGELTRLLAAGLGKRYWGHLPTWTLRLGLGAFADAVLDSQCVVPAKAQAVGFNFADSDPAAFLEQALRPG